MKYIERNKNINRGYRKLDIWKEGIDLFRFLKEKIEKIERISFKTKAQIEDSGLSVSLNIAEGYCRRHLRENIQFNNIALSSLGENYSQIYALFHSEIIGEKWFNKYDDKHYSLENKLIRYNKAQIKMLKSQSDWKDDYRIRELEDKYFPDKNDKNQFE